MRDAFTAQPDDDFDLPAVVRPRPSTRPKRAPAKPQRKPGIAERMLSAASRHPRQVLAAFFLTGCGGAIAWNALVLQSAHHPAPLFAQRALAPATETAPAYSQLLPPARPSIEEPEALGFASVSPPTAPRAPAAMPAPPAPVLKPSQRGAIAEMIRNGGEPVAKANPPASSAVAAAPARTPAVRDPIAEIIRLGGPVPTPPANVGRPDINDLALNGQRALARLGYGVKVDGIMGPGTRQAIERFEQDRRLPVTGEFNTRTARELSGLSGITVQ